MIVVHVIRKPLSEGNVASNVLKWGTGALNIDASRIRSGQMPKDCKAPGWDAYNKTNAEQGYRPRDYKQGDAHYRPSPEGRWPANIILEHTPECECRGIKKVKGSQMGSRSAGGQHGKYGPIGAVGGHDFTDAEGNDAITDWICADGCPVAGLDEQSGELKTHGGGVRSGARKLGFGMEGMDQAIPVGDRGGASRYYKQVQDAS